MMIENTYLKKLFVFMRIFPLLFFPVYLKLTAHIHIMITLSVVRLPLLIAREP